MGKSEFKHKAYETFSRAFCSFVMTGLAWSLHGYCLLLTRLLGSNLYIQVPLTVSSSDILDLYQFWQFLEK